MTPSTDETRGRQALADLTDLARTSASPPTPAQLDRGLAALSSRMVAGQTRRRTVVRWSLAGSFAAIAALAILGAGRLAWSPAKVAPPALAYQIEGGSLIEGGYLRESGRAGIKLVFAEGTEFRLRPGTRGRLRAVDGSGARIAIEHGTASFQVTPSAERRWLVDVGPFLVTVKGTVFTVSWDAGNERFELLLQHGRVTVSGPVSGGDIALRAGERLVVDLSKGETLITEEKSGPAPGQVLPGATSAGEASPGVRPVAPAERSAPGATATAAPIPRLDGDHRWADALAAGHLDRILAEAERTGVKATLEKASSDDLLALADAARYRRRMGLARDALLAERRRYPTSSRSLDAAFLLGRVEEADERGLARAIAWYDEYLARAPGGTYAPEALGRKMTLTSKVAGAARARPIAEEYLRRFPNGTYAGPARALERGP
jgi:TolA-binding protein